MWNSVTQAAEHVSLYSTICGMLWYLLVLLFRLIVVASIGSAVYGDEQSAFQCSTEVIGCENVCYDRFAKISHMRFWSFQILALASPVVVFHFYGIFVEGRIEKLKDVEKKRVEKIEQDEAEKEVENVKGSACSKWDIVRDQLNAEIRRRRRLVGKIKQHKVFNKNKLQEVAFTANIRVAYFLSVIARLVIEIVFLYLAYDLFRFAEYLDVPGAIISDGRRIDNPFDLFWIRVPQLYRCTGKTVRSACGQHMLPGNLDSYVPCWVSRPWEKTIFLRYMNTLSVICLLLCIGEIIQLLIRHYKTYQRKSRERKESNFQYKKAPSDDSFSPDKGTSKVPVQAVTDTIYTANETATEKPPVSFEDAKPPSTTEAPKTEKKLSSNVFVDLATGALNVNELREALKNVDTKPKKTVSTNDVSTKAYLGRRISKALDRKAEMDGAKPNRGLSTKTKGLFLAAAGTQSLNRPPKLTRGRYATLFRLESSDLSHSDGGDDDDGSESESSDATISNHSIENMDIVV